MNKSIPIMMIAGLAACASAQNQFSLSIVPNVTGIIPDSPFTATVYGDANVGTHILGGGFSLVADHAGVADIAWTPAEWSQFNTDGGYAGNGNYNAVIFGQIILPDVPPFDVPAAGSEIGEAIGSFEITLAQSFVGTITFSLVEEAPFSLEVIDIDTGEAYQSTTDTLSLGSFTIFPTPSTLALLGMGGIVGARRRR